MKTTKKQRKTNTQQPEKRPGGLDLTDGHHCLEGASFGFQKHGNRFVMAPGIMDMWHRYIDEQDGLTQFINAHGRFVLEQQKRLSGERRSFWDVVFKTINISRDVLDTHVVKMITDGVVEISPKPKETTEGE